MQKIIRLQKGNYSWPGMYFVTINAKFRKHYFGEIVDNEVILSDIGEEVKRQWLLTPSIRPDMNLALDEFVIMPNHFHGIIGIGKNEINAEFIRSGGTFGPQIKNLGSIIRGFKSSVTEWCLINKKKFDWQSRFWDELIRDDKMLNNIRNYIRNNPKKWKGH